VSTIFTRVSNVFFNLKERLYHRRLPAEINLIKNTNLFSNMDEHLFNKMCHSIHLVKYLKSSMILRQGQKGNTLYIIKKGSVRVFTYDENLNKIPLARLNKGDYFGEQALLGQTNKIRNANIEAISSTTLIAISEKIISKHFNVDSPLRKHLTKKGLKQIFNILSVTNEYYIQIEKLISQIQNPQIVELVDGETIFNVGDNPDYVYLILEGDVKLLVPEQGSHKYTNIILHKGQIFGELGILENKPRQASAIANTNIRLLKIDGADFKNHLPEHQQVQRILAELKKTYEIPNRGAMEQYFGYAEDKTPLITTIYNLNDGRTVISSKYLNQNIFSMLTANLPVDKSYRYQKGRKRIRIYTLDNHLTGIKTTGFFDYLPEICGMILENEIMDEKALQLFESTGRMPILKRPVNKDGSTIICDCMSITRKQIQDQIDNGVRSMAELSRLTGVCTSCGACSHRVLEMLGQSTWTPGVLKKITAHNSYINSYQITLDNDEIKEFKPGQHIIIQIKVRNNWIERPYTISDILSPDGRVQITIKKEPKGYFTEWLHAQVEDEFQINATQPQGDFILKISNTPVLCFAGGIGITPFVTFSRFIEKNNLNQRMHLVYTALTQDDFICTDLFDKITKENPAFTVEYRATHSEGYFTEEEIIKRIHLLGQPDIYICGPTPFLRLLQDTLDKIRYPQDKIYIEKFVHAGG